jgi:hypothetical protein
MSRRRKPNSSDPRRSNPKIEETRTRLLAQDGRAGKLSCCGGNYRIFLISGTPTVQRWHNDGCRSKAARDIAETKGGSGTLATFVREDGSKVREYSLVEWPEP